MVKHTKAIFFHLVIFLEESSLLFFSVIISSAVPPLLNHRLAVLALGVLNAILLIAAIVTGINCENNRPSNVLFLSNLCPSCLIVCSR